MSHPNKPRAVILAAGAGQRLRDLGITVPKPLMQYLGESLLAHNIRSARELCPETPPIVVGTPEVCAAGPLGPTYVRVDYKQPSPVESALLALAHLDPAQPVVFLDCDNHFGGLPRFSPRAPESTLVFTTSAAQQDDEFCQFAWARDQGWQPKAEGALKSDDDVAGVGVYGFGCATKFRALAYALLFKLSGTFSEAKMHMLFAGAYLEVIKLAPGVWTPLGSERQLAAAGRHWPEEDDGIPF
jgi:molybdopterin-guanine dinucleotide biosynthesis protein A